MLSTRAGRERGECRARGQAVRGASAAHVGRPCERGECCLLRIRRLVLHSFSSEAALPRLRKRRTLFSTRLLRNISLCPHNRSYLPKPYGESSPHPMSVPDFASREMTVSSASHTYPSLLLCDCLFVPKAYLRLFGSIIASDPEYVVRPATVQKSN